MNSTVEEITPPEVHAKRQRGDDFVLLDCREPEELQIARIAGALHVPMGDIPSRLTSLDPDRELIVFCHHGKRSYSVAAFLRQQGFEHVKSLRGGIHAWSLQVDPRVPQY